MRKHLAIFSKEHVEDLFKGKKETELRVSQKKIAPYGVLNVGDLVYIKPSGGDIIGQFTIKKVISFEAPDKKDWEIIANLSNPTSEVSIASIPPRRWSSSKVKFVTLIFMDQIEKFITSPIKIKKGDSRAWVVLD